MSVVQTIYRNGGPKAKPFSWSYSKLKNFRACPKRHYNVDIAKTYKEEEGEQLRWGNHLHSEFARYLDGRETDLPLDLSQHRVMLKRYRDAPGDKHVELKLAITADLQPCEFFDRKVEPWYRGVVDFLLIKGPVAAALDWKTGKIVEDSEQLGLTAAMIFAHFPQVQAVRTEFVWLKEDAITRADYKPESMTEFWGKLLPDVNVMKRAHETQEYPPRPNGLCKSYCPVTSCPYHGKGAR